MGVWCHRGSSTPSTSTSATEALVALDAADRTRTAGQLRLSRCQRMVLAEPAQRARRLHAAVAALLSHQLNRSTERRNIMQSSQSPVVPDRDHLAARAAGLGQVRFHRQPKPSRNLAAAASPGGVQHVHAGHVEHRVDARAAATRLHTARRRRHRKGTTRAHRDVLTPRNSEEPNNLQDGSL